MFRMLEEYLKHKIEIKFTLELFQMIMLPMT